MSTALNLKSSGQSLKSAARDGDRVSRPVVGASPTGADGDGSADASSGASSDRPGDGSGVLGSISTVTLRIVWETTDKNHTGVVSEPRSRWGVAGDRDRRSRKFRIARENQPSVSFDTAHSGCVHCHRSARATERNGQDPRKGAAEAKGNRSRGCRSRSRPEEPARASDASAAGFSEGHGQPGFGRGWSPGPASVGTERGPERETLRRISLGALSRSGALACLGPVAGALTGATRIEEANRGSKGAEREMCPSSDSR